MFGVELSKRKFSFSLAPEEIDAQGERAQLAYQSALRDGAVNVYRGRILLIGQDRAGKTSLKKSLIGLPFHPKEKSTEGIEVDSSIFQVDVDKAENWQPIDKSKHSLLGCSQDVAEMIVKELCLPSSHNRFQEEKEGEVKYGSDHTGDCHKNGEQNITDPAGEKEEDLLVNQVWAQLNPHIYMQYCISISLISFTTTGYTTHTKICRMSENWKTCIYQTVGEKRNKSSWRNSWFSFSC